MPRTPSMTAEQAAQAIGKPRGSLFVTKDNRDLVRKWIVAQGFPAAFVYKLPNWMLANAYNHEDGSGLDAIRRKLAANPEASDGPEALAQALGLDESTPEASTAPLPDENPPASFPAPMDAPANIPFSDGSHPLDHVASHARPGTRTDKAQALLDLLQGAGMDRETVESIVQEQLSQFRDLLPDFVAACSPVTRIELVRPDSTVYRVEGITHPKFQTLVKLATARGSDGYVPGIFIAGEASSGKTTGCRMLAEALNLPWHFNGAITQPHEMLGFRDGMGNYHRTPFREAYEHGGVYTFDEADRSDGNALLGVNPHLAGNVGSFPDGNVKKHPNCIIICTANTWGLGGSSDYAGATKLDAAFLSRFPSRLHWDIDEATEIAISGNEGWARRVQAARRRAREAGLKVMICSRMTLAGAALIANGLPESEVASMTYLANLKPEQRSIVEA